KVVIVRYIRLVPSQASSRHQANATPPVTFQARSDASNACECARIRTREDHHCAGMGAAELAAAASATTAASSPPTPTPPGPAAHPAPGPPAPARASPAPPPPAGADVAGARSAGTEAAVTAFDGALAADGGRAAPHVTRFVGRHLGRALLDGADRLFAVAR